MGKWGITTLGEVTTIVAGSTPKTSVDEYWNGKFNWVTPAELNDTTSIIYGTERKITEKAIKDTSLKPLPIGTVLLSSRAPIGKVAIAGAEMYCNQGFKNLICSNKIFNKYLFWFLKGKTEFLNSLGRGATFKEISKTIVEKIEIPLPPLETQKQIANTLDTAAEILGLRKKQHAELDNLIKSTFYDMFGDLALNEKEWNTGELVETCKTKDDVKCGPFGTQLSKDEYQISGVPLWGIPQINASFKIPTTDFLTEEKAESLEAYSIIANDITMSRKGNVGKCAIYPLNSAKGIMHSDVLRIRVNQEKVNPIFILHQLHLSRYIQNQIKLVSGGAIMAGVNVTKLKHIIIHVPPISLQTQFAEIVAKIEEQKTLVNKAIDETQLLFDSLMSEYFE